LGTKWNAPSFRTTEFFATLNLRAKDGVDRVWLVLHLGAKVKDNAKDLQIPLLATNDSHYVDQKDAPSQEHLLCINSGSTMDIPAGDGPPPGAPPAMAGTIPRVCSELKRSARRFFWLSSTGNAGMIRGVGGSRHF
jgi:hypothetical protein